ncbi:response regulator [Natronolimnobius sp. AArcel1]|uniref:hybrid sensor histidine kinase/response regulator n=1 Tax=Natronolimnobius sp. AArcel1 TaxID=1679093 RepID=UPI0013E9B2B7|nr:ATP-binding protein [Natronolimnobius sp. AArcel1]NGM68498.1 response regulator [Natronolimnobius sp. AArcel1]
MSDSIRVLYVNTKSDTLDLPDTRAPHEPTRFEVVTESTAQAALERLKSSDSPIDCVVSEYRLADLDGLELLEWVRQCDPTMAFLLYTDSGSEAIASEAISRGVSEYLPKSATDEATLAERIAAAVEQARDDRQRREDSNLLDEIFDQIPIHLFVKDTAGRHVRVSRHLTEEIEHEGDTLDVPAFTRANIFGKTDIEIGDSEHERQSYADDMHVIETGEPIINKAEYSPNADEWNLTSKVPWYDENGEIKGLFGATKRITDRKRYQQELERQNDRLEEFTGIVSHDLRNPLNVAQGHLEQARLDCDSEHLAAVAQSHDRMETLIENLLTIAREGEAVTEFETLRLAALADACWATVKTDEAELRLESDTMLRANRNRVKQLLENLLCNAVAHSSGDVTVTVGAIDGGPDFYVADDGPGIPEAERERVLERGYSTATDGTGFGLSIVMQIVEAHGWKLTITESDDGGARFEITGVDDPTQPHG